MSVSTIHPKRLRWACRRGMLELDVMLGRFLDQHETLLSELERVHLAKLLAEEDVGLCAWLLDGVPHPDAALQALIERIRVSF